MSSGIGDPPADPPADPSAPPVEAVARRPRPNPALDPDRYDPANDSAREVPLGELMTVLDASGPPSAEEPAPPPNGRAHRVRTPRRAAPRTRVTDAVTGLIPRRLRGMLETIGRMYTMFVSALYRLVIDVVRGRFVVGEFIDRSWFLTNVTVLPAILVSIPLGVAIALQVGALASQIGATSFVGAADAIGVLREASPIITALLLAGVGGSAVCAELGSRTIREEIDAMVVLGLDPLRRLVGPLIVAGVVVATFLNFVVIFVSVLAAYVFDIAVLHGTKGSFFASFTQFASVADFLTSEIKAAVFGLVAVMIAADRGLTAKRGPTGVGEAVNQSVVVTGLVLFAINLIITQIFFAVVPQRTF